MITSSVNNFIMKTEPLHIQESDNATITNSGSAESSHGWFSKRHLLAGILCLGFFSLFSLNMNTSLVLIEMTKNRTVLINGTNTREPEFHWSSEMKGWILSAFAYGHLCSFLVPWILKTFGGITTNGLTLLLGGVINVLYPTIVRFNFHLFLFMRMVEGLLEDVGFLSAFEIWSNWAPKKERSKLLSIQFTGSYIAAAVIFPVSGYLAYIWQWPAAYYFAGGMAIFISCIILLFFSNEPATDKHISEKERKYLLKEVEKSPQNKVSIPWKAILTSVPLWALFIMQFSYVCGLAFLAICLPHYVKDMTNMEIHTVGMLSGIPNLIGIFTVPLIGCLADYLQNKNILNATQVHKSYTFGGLVLSAGCVFLLAFIGDTNFTINIILLILFKLLLSLSDLVTKFVPLFMAPNHSSLVASAISYSYFLGLLVIPMLMGYVVKSHDPCEWAIVLSSLAVILLAGGLIFIFFGSSQPQPWSQPNNEPDREKNMENLLP